MRHKFDTRKSSSDRHVFRYTPQPEDMSGPLAHRDQFSTPQGTMSQVSSLNLETQEQHDKKRRSIVTSFKYFPDSVKTKDLYLRFLKQLTYFTMSTICYNRQLFDVEGNYSCKWHSVIPIHILSPTAVDPNVRKLVNSLVTATSLVDSKKLKKLIFGILEDPTKPDELVEYYCLQYKYIDDYIYLTDLSSKCLKLMSDIELNTHPEERDYYFVVKVLFDGDLVELDGFRKSKDVIYVGDSVSSRLIATVDDIFSVSVAN